MELIDILKEHRFIENWNQKFPAEAESELRTLIDQHDNRVVNVFLQHCCAYLNNGINETQEKGIIKFVNEAINQGFNIDTTLVPGNYTCLHLILQLGVIELVQPVIDSASANIENYVNRITDHQTALSIVYGDIKKSKYKQCLILLINKGARINKSCVRMIMRHLCEKFELPASVQNILNTYYSNHGLNTLTEFYRLQITENDIDLRTVYLNIIKNCKTSLICNNDYELVERLLELGADINASDNFGDTPLSLSVRRNDVEMAKLLIEHNANCYIYSNGKHVLELALDCGNHAVIPLLLNADSFQRLEGERKEDAIEKILNIGSPDMLAQLINEKILVDYNESDLIDLDHEGIIDALYNNADHVHRHDFFEMYSQHAYKERRWRALKKVFELWASEIPSEIVSDYIEKLRIILYQTPEQERGPIQNIMHVLKETQRNRAGQIVLAACRSDQNHHNPITKTMNITKHLAEISKQPIRALEHGSFESISELWQDFIIPRLPETKTALRWHKVLMEYIQQPDAVFPVRGYNSEMRNNYHRLRRGFLTHTSEGYSFFYTDNFHAAYYLKMALDGFVPTANELLKEYQSRRFPSRFGPNTKEERELMALQQGKDPGFQTAGYLIAHVFEAGKEYYHNGICMSLRKNILDRFFPRGERTDWTKRSDETGTYYLRELEVPCDARKYMVAAFLRFVHPFNYFLMPKTTACSTDISGNYKFLNYVKNRLHDLYGEAYDEFLGLIMPNSTSIPTLSDMPLKKYQYGIGINTNCKCDLPALEIDNDAWDLDIIENELIVAQRNHCSGNHEGISSEPWYKDLILELVCLWGMGTNDRILNVYSVSSNKIVVFANYNRSYISYLTGDGKNNFRQNWCEAAEEYNHKFSYSSNMKTALREIEQEILALNTCNDANWQKYLSKNSGIGNAIKNIFAKNILPDLAYELKRRLQDD